MACRDCLSMSSVTVRRVGMVLLRMRLAGLPDARADSRVHPDPGLDDEAQHRADG
eukprot:CAMPEP_0168495574 /NCGR_PEP_ID=MMETSP0228-20121227/71810_1 /TAXON_ID=133427 /ORGANISM="Protoceratium reticulatum, Strain CCCM 535 (=CCMP 1889)" /LENGTH=54 /DNA_ID=CAMNT_0008512403 /DNA_START=26 /DNA_END=186 /DNA_ORIENTATION=+